MIRLADHETNLKRKLLLLNETVAYSWYYGEYDRGLQVGLKAKAIAQKHHLDSIAGLIDNNIGICYDYKGIYSEALNHFFSALRTAEKIQDRETEAYILSNIGLIYNNQELYDKALEYHKKSLQIRKKAGNISGISASTNNMAIVYMDQNMFDKAIYYFKEVVKIDQSIPDSSALSDDFNNLGVCYEKKNSYEEALFYHQLSLTIKQRMHEKRGIANSLYNIGIVAKKQGKLEVAERYLKEAEEKANTLGYKELQRIIYDNLRELYYAQKKINLAYDYLILFQEIDEQIDNEETVRSQTQTELTYQFDKKQETIRLKQVKKDLEIKKQQEQSRIILVAAIIVGMIILVFSLILWKRWKEARKQQIIIAEKNRLVELKNNEILDSITYAKRIQTAILPSDELLEQGLKDYFVLYEPKDIVAGDFYWFEETASFCFLAVADCTGHGVPGAMMSVVCHNALNRSVKEFKESETGKILDKTREIIIDELSKNKQDVYDGMDISLIAWNKTNYTIQWSGANNPLWIWKQSTKEILEYKGDKQPIGRYALSKPFTTHSIQIEPNDRLFLFTDGYADQFGGPESKKFKSKNLKSLISETCTLDLHSQKDKIQDVFTYWKGDKEQIDDVCILGLHLALG